MATIMQHVEGLTKVTMSKTHTEHVIKVINRSSFTMSELDALCKAAVKVALMAVSAGLARSNRSRICAPMSWPCSKNGRARS